jgi:hypothetical protein
MVDFSDFELSRLARVMTSLRGKIDRTDYFEKGTVLEKAVATYSDGQLARINEEGRDFEDIDGNTYEQKIVTIQKKPRGGPQISSFIIKNWHGETKDYSETMLADYYIFLDVSNLKMCVVPRDFIKIKDSKAANVTASCDPLPEHFIELPQVDEAQSFFRLKDKWVKDLLESVPA